MNRNEVRDLYDMINSLSVVAKSLIPLNLFQPPYICFYSTSCNQEKTKYNKMKVWKSRSYSFFSVYSIYLRARGLKFFVAGIVWKRN